MARWIAFDEETSQLLRSRVAPESTVETLNRGPVEYALARPGTVVAVLPAPGGNEAGIAIFRRSRVQQQPLSRREAALPLEAMPGKATRAGGFLGLSDEPVFEEDAPREKRGWWRRFWDE